MCRPNLHMLLSLPKKKLSYEKKDSPWELGTSQLLSGSFLPQWLLRVDLFCVWKKSSLLFFESTLTSYFLQLMSPGICHFSAQWGGPGREVSQKEAKSPFPFSHTGTLRGCDRGGRKSQGLARSNGWFLPHPPQPDPQGCSGWENGFNLPASTLQKEAQRFLRQLTKSFEATLLCSIILDQSWQSLIISFRCKFF